MCSVYAPPVSVVLASRYGGPMLARCLDSLGRQTLAGAETIVADASGETTEWARRYPDVRFLAARHHRERSGRRGGTGSN